MKPDQPVLVILSPGFPVSETDTTCLTSQQNLILAFNRIDPSLKIIILSFQYPFVKAIYHWHGNTVIPFNGQNKGQLSRLLLWGKVWQQLRKIHRENKLTGLFSFWCGECALAGKYFGTWYHIPQYCWILGQDARASNKYVRLVRPRGEQLVALSDFLQEEFCRNHGIRPMHIIPNGVVPGQYQGAPYNRCIDVLGAGSLIPLKQYDVFIKVIHLLRQSLPGIRAVICGKGPEEDHLRLLIEQYNLQDTIILEGEIPHPEILKRMQQSKLLLHTSSYEGFSTVCMEALYAGCRVASFCSPMKAPIDNWYMVKSPEEMVEISLFLLKNAHLVNSRVMPFSMEDTARAILRLYGHNNKDDIF